MVDSQSWGFVNGQGTSGFHGDVVGRYLVIRARIDIDSRNDEVLINQSRCSNKGSSSFRKTKRQ